MFDICNRYPLNRVYYKMCNEFYIADSISYAYGAKNYQTVKQFMQDLKSKAPVEQHKLFW